MDIEALENMVLMGPPTNNSADVRLYAAELTNAITDLISAVKRSEVLGTENKRLRELLVKAQNFSCFGKVVPADVCFEIEKALK